MRSSDVICHVHSRYSRAATELLSAVCHTMINLPFTENVVLSLLSDVNDITCRGKVHVVSC